ncbi:MAG: hypothetical protein KDB60_03450 [Propionibacteriaceae bacterium]|nr:hypothetical protein [Propionibacteriaceae bacterium]
MSTLSPATAAFAGAGPRRPRSLRIGLVLAALFTVLDAIPAVSEIGLDGTAWDVLVIFLAIFCPLSALATLILLPFAWHGRRRPAQWVAGIQVASILGLWPPFVLYFVDGLPLIAPISAGVGYALSLLAAWLIVRGTRPAEPGSPQS